MTVERIQSVLQLMTVGSFIRAALKTCPFIADLDAAILEVADALPDPDVALLVVHEDDLPVGMALLRNNDGSFMRGVSFTHLYVSGSSKSRTALIEAAHEFARERKAPHVWGVDINDRPAAFNRLFRRWNPVRQGTTFRYPV